MKPKDALFGLLVVAAACQYEKRSTNPPEKEIVTVDQRDEMRRVFEALHTTYISLKLSSPDTIAQERESLKEATEEINLLTQSIDAAINHLKACIDAPSEAIFCDPIEEALEIIGLSSSLLKITEATYGESDELERTTHYVKKIHNIATRVLRTGNYSE